MWAGTVRIDLDDKSVHVRLSSGRLYDAVRRVFPSHAVHYDVLAAYSLVDGGNGGRRGVTSFSVMYKKMVPVVRTVDTGRLLDALGSYLSCDTETQPDHQPRLAVTVLVRNGAALILPAAPGIVAPHIERALHRAGFSTVDRPWVTIDFVTNEVIVPPPSVSLDTTNVDVRAVVRQGDPRTWPGRYPITHVLVTGDDASVELSARALVLLIRAWTNVCEDNREGLTGLAQLVHSSSLIEVGFMELLPQALCDDLILPREGGGRPAALSGR